MVGSGDSGASVVTKYRDPDWAASYLGVDKKALERMRHYGGGPRYYKLGRRVRYTEEDLDAYMASRSACSTSEAAA